MDDKCAVSGGIPEKYISMTALDAICRRVMKASEELLADSADYRIGQWAGADKVFWEASCYAETGADYLEKARTETASEAAAK